MTKRRIAAISLVAGLFVLAAGIVWAETRYWRGTRYVLPAGGGFKRAVEEVLTDHRMTFEADNAALQAQIDALQIQVNDNGNDITSNANDITDLQTLLGDVQVYEEQATPVLQVDPSMGPTVLVTDTVNVPSAGILLIWADQYSERWTGSPAGSYCTFWNWLEVDGSQVTLDTAAEMADNGPGPWDTENIALTAAVPVTAGAHTIDHVGRAANGAGSAIVIFANLRTLFIPFGQGPLPAVAPQGGKVPAAALGSSVYPAAAKTK